MASEGNGSGGAGKWIAIGCLALLLIVVGGGYCAYVKIKGGAQEVAATVAEEGAMAVINEFGLPETDKAAFEEVVKEFTQEIRAGEVGLKEGVSVLKELGEGGGLQRILTAALAIRFEQTYLPQSGLDAAAQEEAVTTVTRFARGTIDGTIELGESKAISEAVTVTVTSTGPDGTTVTKTSFKKTLGDEELTELLAKMKELADTAEVAAEVAKVDPAAELKKVIEAGRAKAAKEK